MVRRRRIAHRSSAFLARSGTVSPRAWTRLLATLIYKVIHKANSLRECEWSNTRHSARLDLLRQARGPSRHRYRGREVGDLVLGLGCVELLVRADVRRASFGAVPVKVSTYRSTAAQGRLLLPCCRRAAAALLLPCCCRAAAVRVRLRTATHGDTRRRTAQAQQHAERELAARPSYAGRGLTRQTC